MIYLVKCSALYYEHDSTLFCSNSITNYSENNVFFMGRSKTQHTQKTELV